MKKMGLFLWTTLTVIVFFAITAYAETGATIDTTQTAKGIVVVSLTDYAGKTIKAQVVKGKDKYTYTLKKSQSNLPLQMGTGEYTVTVLENITGDRYMPLATEVLTITAFEEKEVYTASIPIIEYSVSAKAVPAFQKLTEEKKTETDKIMAVYENIVNNYSYDFDKAATIKSDYIPILDDVYEAKKGVCYDYASLMSGVLRSFGIPTRLVMGYRTEVEGYHAWNEIKIDGNWVAVDTTYDAQVIKAGKKPMMKKDEANATIVKFY